MNWKKEAERDLRRYYSLKESLENIPEQIAALKTQRLSVKSAWSDTVPVQGGASRVEDTQINSIVKEERLKHNYRAIKRLVELMDRALSTLSEDDRYILEVAYIDRRRDAIGVICEKYHVERTKAYDLRNKALQEFTLKMYGIIDL